MTAYYDLKKKTCSVGRDFQICEAVIKDDYPSYDFEYCKSKECDNCLKKLWELSDDAASSKPSLCSLCGLYFQLFHKHRPNAKPTNLIYDTSEIEHPSHCRYINRRNFEPEEVKPNFYILNQNIYCVRGRDLLSFFSSVKDKCRISKKAWSILRIKEPKNFKEIYLFSSRKKIFNEEEGNNFGFYFYDLDLKNDLTDQFDHSFLNRKDNGRRAKSLPFGFEYTKAEENSIEKEDSVAEENGNDSQEDITNKNLIKQESEGVDSGMDMDVSLPLTHESYEDEVFELPEMESTLTSEAINDVEMAHVCSENTQENEEKEILTVIDYPKPNSVNGVERDGISPELDGNFSTNKKMLESSETNSPISMKNVAESDDDIDVCPTWKVITSDGNVYEINKEEEREVLVKPELTPKERNETDEYDLYYLGRESHDGRIIFDYGNDFYALYQKKLSCRKNVFSSIPAEKVSKRKVIEGKTPDEWLRESHLQKSYLEFINGELLAL